MSMKWEKNNRTIKHPHKKVQKVNEVQIKVIGLKEKKAIVRMAVKAIHTNELRSYGSLKRGLHRMVKALHSSKAFKPRRPRRPRSRGLPLGGKKSKKLGKQSAMQRHF